MSRRFLLRRLIEAAYNNKTLRLGVNAVNYADDDRAEGSILVLRDLTGGIAFVDDQHAFADTHAHAAIDRDEIAAGFTRKIFLLDDHHLLPVIEWVIDRRDDVASDGADDHGEINSSVGTDRRAVRRFRRARRSRP